MQLLTGVGSGEAALSFLCSSLTPSEQKLYTYGPGQHTHRCQYVHAYLLRKSADSKREAQSWYQWSTWSNTGQKLLLLSTVA